jgi:hypothetical protein
MEVVGHDHKFVKFVFFLIPVFKQSLNEEHRRSVRLKKGSLLQCGRGHKVCAVSGCSAVWNCHNSFALKRVIQSSALNAALKRCSTHEESRHWLRAILSFRSCGSRGDWEHASRIVKRINRYESELIEKIHRQFQNEIESRKPEGIMRVWEKAGVRPPYPRFTGKTSLPRPRHP